MKKGILLICIFLGFSLSQEIKAQSRKTPPSDAASGYTYDFNKAKELIIEEQLKFGNSSIELQSILQHKDFPVLKSKEELNDSYHQNLRKWMESNPDVIISAFKKRNDIVQPY